MVEVRHSWDTPFDRVPDEIMIEIFSFFSFNELIDVTQHVCTRWKKLAHHPVLWRDKEFIIRGSKLRGRGCCGVLFTNCMHCRCVRSDEEVLRTASTMPQLRRLTLGRNVKEHILRKICTYWPNVTDLCIDGRQKMTYSLLKYIVKKFPKIQKLKVGTGLLPDSWWLEMLSGLEHLRSLEVFTDDSNELPIQLYGLAYRCPQLQEIHLKWPTYIPFDLDDFLRAKKNNLTSATLFWTVGIEGSKCVVTQLKECGTSLRKLRLLHFDVPSTLQAAAFEALGKLHTLHDLYINWVSPDEPQVISLAFWPGCLTRLQKLELDYASNLQDKTVVTISQGCPNLRELRIKFSEEITDVALSEIDRLKYLEILDLSGCRGLGGTAMAYIAQLPALHTLVLQHMRDLAKLQPSLRRIVDLKELRCLDILQSYGIEGVPFGEFPGRLVKLRELHVLNKGENVFAELQHKMPRLKISHAIPLTDEYDTDEWSDGEG